MSFLNPVNEPVICYKSTDDGAPQLNYASRTAGDIKAILKACLVTGYGTKSGAGWTISEEVGSVCVFASPYVGMSAHKLKIDDSLSSDTKWSDIYNAEAAVLMGGAVSKSNSAINTTHASNGWEMMVTNQGFLLIENAFNTGVSQVGSRLTYYGRMKSGYSAETGKNISWWCIGHHSPTANQGMPCFFFDTVRKEDKYHKLGTTDLSSAYGILTLAGLKKIGITASVSDIDLCCEWLFMSGDVALCQQPSLMWQFKTGGAAIPVIRDDISNGRPISFRWPLRGSADENSVLITSHGVAAIYTDYWEY